MLSALHKAKQQASRRGVQPESIPAVVDIGGTRGNVGFNHAPCLTKARAGGRAFWSLQHGSKITMSEMCRIQGINPKSIKISLTPAQMGERLGNAFTLPVFAAVLSQALRAAVAP